MLCEKRKVDHMSRIETLIGDMTLAEKLGQLTMTAAGYAVTGPVIAGDSTDAIGYGTIGSLLNLFGAGPVHEMQRLAVEESRLGIPLLIAFDVIHGHRSLFPVPLAEAALFDRAGLGAHRARIGQGGRRRRSCDDFRADARRVTRSALGSQCRGSRRGPVAWRANRAAKVRGFQGADLAAPDALAAVAKHYCAYGSVTAGGDYASVDVSERSVHEVHLPPFAAAIAAGVAA